MKTVLEQALEALMKYSRAGVGNSTDFVLQAEAAYSGQQVIAALKEAIKQGEIVVTKDDSGAIVCVTRQDEEGQILSVIAESTIKQQGGPVAVVADDYDNMAELLRQLPAGTKLYTSAPKYKEKTCQG
jgi:hypothetical protein